MCIRDRFSIIFLIAFLIALVAGLALPPGNAFYRNLILGVQVPVEAGLLSVLAVMLLVASLKPVSYTHLAWAAITGSP